jgi:hypothetical protein
MNATPHSKIFLKLGVIIPRNLHDVSRQVTTIAREFVQGKELSAPPGLSRRPDTAEGLPRFRQDCSAGADSIQLLSCFMAGQALFGGE